MVVVLDVFDDSEGDWKIPSDLAVKKVLLTVLVPAVQQNIQNVLLFVPLIVILRVRTPYPIEITVAEKVHQSPVLSPWELTVQSFLAASGSRCPLFRQLRR